MGGGNSRSTGQVRNTGGLSPRGRGKRHRQYPGDLPGRSIPAWAGETGRHRHPQTSGRVYPRVGGGNIVPGVQGHNESGLSPRGRGKHDISHRRFLDGRSIPAWAGETPPGSARPESLRVYPRVGGGNRQGPEHHFQGGGLSPRGRGKRRRAAQDIQQPRSIPAWAGETPERTTSISAARVYPRVGGGNALARATTSATEGLSPRGRGKRRADKPRRPELGSIPAWAGETGPRAGQRRRQQVYPRVGGGNVSVGFSQSGGLGLSPRGRGKLRQRFNALLPRGSIPAWAGETYAGPTP